MSSALSLPRAAAALPGLATRLRRLFGYRVRLMVIGVLLVCCAASVLVATSHPSAPTVPAPVAVRAATMPTAPRTPIDTPAAAAAPVAVAAPPASPAPPRSGSVVLHRGDTLWGLAGRYGTTVTALQRLNNLGHSTLIRAGATLRIPATTATYRPAASTGRSWGPTPAAATVHAKVSTQAHATSAAPPARAGTDAAHQAAMAVFGSQYTCAADIITRESGWNVHATNRSSGAYGLAQALPGTKMTAAGPGWRDDPATQLAWMRTYVDARYGGACGAWAFWQTHHWY